jgi:toxin YoeB
MNRLFTDETWDDYLYWQASDKQILRKVNLFIKEIQRNPFIGTGKPEPLKHSLQGCWSRRINSEHRLVYEIDKNIIKIMACRFHY